METERWLSAKFRSRVAVVEVGGTVFVKAVHAAHETRSGWHPACRRAVASSPAEMARQNSELTTHCGGCSGRQDAVPLRQAGCPPLRFKGTRRGHDSGDSLPEAGFYWTETDAEVILPLSRTLRPSQECVRVNRDAPGYQMTTKTKETLTTKPSNSAGVDEFVKDLKHPLKTVAEELRQIILSADKTIGEEIFWNAPSFFYTGRMKPFKPKEYKRYIVGFNFFKQDCVRLIFLRGALVGDQSGLLEGDYADGRRLALFHDSDEVKAKRKDLQKIIKTLLKLIRKS